MTEIEERSHRNRLPSRKLLLVALIALASAMTLALVHVTGRWARHGVLVQTDRPREPGADSWEEPRQSVGGAWLRSRGGRRKNKDWLSEKQVSPHQVLDGSAKGEIFAQGVNFSEEFSEVNNIFGGRQALDPPKQKPSGAASLQTGSQTALRTFLPDVSRSERVVVNPESGARTSIQGKIRDEMVPKPPRGPSEEDKFSGDNSYQWNDRDPKAYSYLPLRHQGDREWKKEDAVIFNRVGKCGSRTIINILRQLNGMNSFNLISSTVYNQTHISPSWQGHIVKTLEKVKTPYMFQRHLHFIDFAAFNAERPMYINLIRDPLSRFVSNYYFKRFGDGRSSQNFKGSDEAKYRSVSDCIIQGYKECVNAGRIYIIPFFCGQLRECRQPTQWALDRAKENVEKHFLAVGILEDLENSFKVFEKVLPQFFSGAVKLLLQPDENMTKKNASTTTKFKEMPSEKAASVMRGLMHYEYEFYDFIKEKLEKQMENYGITR